MTLAERIANADLVTLSEGHQLTVTRYTLTDAEQQGAARAVNSYADMLEALKCAEWLIASFTDEPGGNTLFAVRAAIAKADSRLLPSTERQESK